MYMNREEWIIKAIEKHNDKYDYSKVKYTGCYEKVCIICRKHGEFWQKAHSHLRGCGCPIIILQLNVKVNNIINQLKLLEAMNNF